MVKICKCMNCGKQFLIAPPVEYEIEFEDTLLEIVKFPCHDCGKVYGKIQEIGTIKDLHDCMEFLDMNVIIAPIKKVLIDDEDATLTLAQYINALDATKTLNMKMEESGEDN